MQQLVCLLPGPSIVHAVAKFPQEGSNRAHSSSSLCFEYRYANLNLLQISISHQITNLW